MASLDTQAGTRLTLPETGDHDQLAAHLQAAFERQRAAFMADMAPDLAVRLGRLARLKAMINSHESQIVAAINEDFGGRARQQTQLADLLMVLQAIRLASKRLKGWMKTRKVKTQFNYRPGSNRVMRQPLGVIGIVSPWNYPLNLALGPAVGALAAGNRVMIKPSEYTPKFSALLQDMVAKTFAPEEMLVVPGDAATGKAFVELPFDHLVFTGSTAVGRMVATAAARNLTPVTLELGGKSPAVIDASADMAAAARSIAHGKLLNGGQTCISPDYVLVPKAREAEFVAAFRAAAGRQYPHFMDNADYTAIISDAHLARLDALVADAAAKGGTIVRLSDETRKAEARRFAPVMIQNPSGQMRVMQEEIFGPILPVLTYETLAEAISLINSKDRPLSLYWFGTDKANRDGLLRQTVTGGVTINDCLMHFAQENAPFGGVGASGNGAYHGEWGFLTFTKQTHVYYQSPHSLAPLLHPPYGKVFALLWAWMRRTA
ncbi:MAG: coniferyl aldehyde dehydrogenase [Hyphomicrobiales bacterium]|nr:coniferyl aldehyde dehydrogenase [Hyphomicrobiales bacterium]